MISLFLSRCVTNKFCLHTILCCPVTSAIYRNAISKFSILIIKERHAIEILLSLNTINNKVTHNNLNYLFYRIKIARFKDEECPSRIRDWEKSIQNEKWEKSLPGGMRFNLVIEHWYKHLLSSRRLAVIVQLFKGTENRHLEPIISNWMLRKKCKLSVLQKMRRNKDWELLM